MDVAGSQSDLSATAVVPLSAVDSDHLELALEGSYPTGARYLGSEERASVQQTGRLADGQPWTLPLALRVEGPAAVGDRLLLTDPESVPVAVLSVAEVVADGGGAVVAGALTAVGARSARVFSRLRSRPSRTVAAGGPATLVVPTDRLLHAHDLDSIRAAAAASSAQVVVLALTGAGRRGQAALVRGLLAVVDDLGAQGAHGAPGAEVRVLPVPALPDLDEAGVGTVLAGIAARHGATSVLLPHGVAAAPVRRPAPVGTSPAVSVASAPPPPVLVGAPGPVDDALLERLLDDGAPLPHAFTAPRVEHELRRMHPPLSLRGVVLLFSGLSGSGKSTLAAAVVDALMEQSDREVSVLDGDVVRTMLSAGLGFSRVDREHNVRRIGYVAAEIARHGGTAVCAPIAPYASTRAEFRTLVEAAGGVLVLVHVSTPLEVCEARDRKGLYARARAGLIPEFTGISDPYEKPDDADLSVDTSVVSLQDGVDGVMRLLRQRGLVRVS